VSATLRDAAIISALSAVVALGVNAVRGHGLPVFADEEYQILVPCPEPVGDVEAVAPTDVGESGGDTLVIDARGKAEFDSWHFDGAWHVAFDFLDPTSDEQIERIAGSRARRVIVYGDGADPDSGRELAREIAGKGIRNLFFLEGGAPALREASDGGGKP